MSEFSARRMTAAGTAAIAAVRLEGPGAAAFLRAHLAARDGAETEVLPAVGRQRWLRWVDAAGLVDDVVVVALPASAGGGYEVQGHGGAAAAGLWPAAVRQGGGAWLEAEAHTAAGGGEAAELEQEAGWRADFGRVWGGVETELQAAVVAASQARILTQFRQEPDRRRWPREFLEDLLVGAGDRIAGLLARRRVLLAGPVNAGKSTLLNALLADRRAVTSAEPGTTRDLVSGRIELGGMAVELIDSAGLREAATGPAETGKGGAAAVLEQQGMGLTVAMQSQVDWTVWLSPSEAPAPLPAGWRRCSAVISKADLTAGVMSQLGGEVAFSARTGAGVGELLTHLAEKLWPTAKRSAATEAGVCSAAQRAAVAAWLAR